MVVGPGSALVVNYNSGSLGSPLTGTVFQVGNADGVNTRIEADAFATSAFFTAVRSNGTAASPTTLTANDQIGGFNGWGHNGTSVVGPQATIRTFASQTWTTSHLGTYASIATTPNNSTTLAEVARFENDGGVTIPSTVTGGSMGVGTINAGGLFVNGVSVGAKTSCVTDIAPVVGDDNLITILNPSSAVHITRFSCGVTGTTSVIGNLTKSSLSLISDATCTAGTANQVVVTTFANGSSQCGGTSSCAVAAHAPVTLHLGTISGTPTGFTVCVDYTVD